MGGGVGGGPKKFNVQRRQSHLYQDDAYMRPVNS